MRKSRSNYYKYNMEKVVSSSDNDKNNQKLKDRECNGGGSFGRVSDDAEQMLSTWPQRHYKCCFCKRRFKSAQALGGHMNVHRRARALIRSQSISPNSSVPSSSTSPWHPTNITAAHHASQNDEIHFILTSPNLSCSLLNPPHLTANPSYPFLLSHLPMMSITSPSTLGHIIPPIAAVSAYKNAPGSQFLHDDQPFNGVIWVKKSHIMVEDKLKGLLSIRNTHQDDALVRLSLGNGLIIINSTDQQDIDLELHL